MTHSASQEIPSELRGLAERLAVERVAIVDDAFDDFSQQELNFQEKEDLWQKIEGNSTFFKELKSLNFQISGAEDMTSENIEILLGCDSTATDFQVIWDSSIVGFRVESEKAPLQKLRDILEETLNPRIQEFGSDTAAKEVVKFGPQLLFLDWHLGEEGSLLPTGAMEFPESIPAVKASQDLIQSIWQEWQENEPKPIVVLMSSKPDVEKDSDRFCRYSEILRGMFYFAPKNELADDFQFRNYLHLFLNSRPAGLCLQDFVDSLGTEFDKAKGKFLTGVRDLTLGDYSYIQSLCLQDDGQPLGDYLLWLFSAYFGKLLFDGVLQNESASLDTSIFRSALPSLFPPSNKLTEIYHSALFDCRSVPSKQKSESGQGSELQEENGEILALGDIFRLQNPHSDRPELLLLINPQCDLVIRPNSESKKKRTLLLLPGSLKRILDEGYDSSKPKTELYVNGGESYRVEWDTKRPLSIPEHIFKRWRRLKGYEHVNRLRLSFALEIQRAFASDLTRVGSPVAAPIYLSVFTLLLRRNDEKVFENAGDLEEREKAFLVLGRTSQKCVLTLPLLARLKDTLVEQLEKMHDLATEIDESNSNPMHIQEKIGALDRWIKNESEWAKLRSPIDLPNLSKGFFGGHVQILRGKHKGDPCKGKVVAAICLEIGGTAD